MPIIVSQAFILTQYQLTVNLSSQTSSILLITTDSQSSIIKGASTSKATTIKSTALSSSLTGIK